MEYQAELNETTHRFYSVFQVLKVLPLVCFYNTVIRFFSSYCFTSADAIFHNFLEMQLTLSETIFFMNVLLLMDSLTSPLPPAPPTHTHWSKSAKYVISFLFLLS